jgi:hypothetical protein
MAEALDEGLEAELRQLMERVGSVATIARGQVNRIDEVSSEGVTISTESSDGKGLGPQLIPAWMLNVAWRHLLATGSLSNRYLVSSDGLNVKRSSAVCALLAQLPGVTVASTQPIELRHRS